MFELEWTNEAKTTYHQLKVNPSERIRCKAIKKTLGYLAHNPRHNSLQTHPFLSLEGPNGEKVFEAYAQQKTPAVFRVFWYYGPKRGTITIFLLPLIQNNSLQFDKQYSYL